jgi:hypothetical protein
MHLKEFTNNDVEMLLHPWMSILAHVIIISIEQPEPCMGGDEPCSAQQDIGLRQQSVALALHKYRAARLTGMATQGGLN